MTFDEFESASPSQLREHARRCFEEAQSIDLDPLGLKQGLMQEAQFYMAALERKQSEGVARRDFWMEVGVIGLIAMELILAVYGLYLGNQQAINDDKLMTKQNGILTNLDTSTAGTLKGFNTLSDTMNALKDSMTGLKSVTQTMNQAVHDQLAAYYDPTVSIEFQESNKSILFYNRGNTNVMITDVKLRNLPYPLDGPRLVAAHSSHFFGITNAAYDELVSNAKRNGSENLPISIGFRSELGKLYQIDSIALFMWHDDKLEVFIHTSPLVRK